MNKIFYFLVMFVVFLFAAHAAAGEVYNEVLVDRAPTYSVGDALKVDLDVPQIGSVSIRLQSEGIIQKHGLTWAQFNTTAVVPILGTVSVPVFVQLGTWNGHTEYEGVMYRVNSTLRFPLRENDTFTNTYLSSQPCRRGAGSKCMEIDSIETCSGFMPTLKGIQYVCTGSNGLKTQYIMDREFKWLVEFQAIKLN